VLSTSHREAGATVRAEGRFEAVDLPKMFHLQAASLDNAFQGANRNRLVAVHRDITCRPLDDDISDGCPAG